MTTLIILAIATTATALLTGRVLAEKKRKLFQLEMVHEEMKRQLNEAELRKRPCAEVSSFSPRSKGRKSTS